MLPWFENNQFPLFLAPMAGFTDTVFRQLCKEYGADVMVTEFVMADALLKPEARDRLWETVDFAASQRPMGVQIFGSRPDRMAAAAALLRQELAPDFIDINFGCPAPRVTDQCAGSALLRDPQQLQKVVRESVSAVSGFPVTAKIRIGWDEDSIVACEVAQAIEEAGASALAVHGRTRKQGYKGQANWQVIAKVAEHVSIPVIGNGDVADAQKVRTVQQETQLRGVMIGRAALGYPWVFREIKQTLQTGLAPERPDLDERWAVMLRYCEALLARPATRWNDLKWMRPRLKSFTSRMPAGRKLRHALDHVTTYTQLKDLARSHIREHSLENSPGGVSVEVLSC